ncbi:uncharacterized protein LOC126667964 isoform X1 [Mercurialis annua]|uniref:uncharacterized protein LOC126667964 isoform X1 n=1 Tax=Mercurialis annua TaxID=3986 RepID=UPI0021605B87|nr:uncharacterized protein LOC126667964 isoform X1 [Mercurialis annua]
MGTKSAASDGHERQKREGKDKNVSKRTEDDSEVSAAKSAADEVERKKERKKEKKMKRSELKKKQSSDNVSNDDDGHERQKCDDEPEADSEIGAAKIVADVVLSNHEVEKEKEKKTKRSKSKKRSSDDVINEDENEHERQKREVKEKKVSKRREADNEVTAAKTVVDADVNNHEGEKEKERKMEKKMKKSKSKKKQSTDNIVNKDDDGHERRKSEDKVNNVSKRPEADSEVCAAKFVADVDLINHEVEEERKKLKRSKSKNKQSSDSVTNKDEKKRKKRKREHITSEGVEADSPSKKSASKGTSKRVSFSEGVQIFESSDDPSDGETDQNKKLVRGKRFSPEEDELVKTSVLNYINNQGLGEEGLQKVLHCKKHPELKHCWKEIGAALPWRPSESVYYRAHILFERDENRSWTEEELELVQKFHDKYGPDWKTLADALGKHRVHVKDAWRRIKLANRNRGKWSQEEYQNLFDLVNMDLRMKAFEERRLTKHGMLRDNIAWTAISDKLGTRTTPMCCMKWYNQLTSPMVADGEWFDVDDYHLLITLYELDACCMEDVEWDDLLEHRTGYICRKRWSQMTRNLDGDRHMSFANQVEVLIKRYCPDVLEAREAYYSKPVA